MRSLRSIGVLVLLGALASCATGAPPKKYGWGGQPASSGGGAGTVTSVSGTAPIAVATGTTTPAISIAAATTSAAGSMPASSKLFDDLTFGWARDSIAVAQTALGGNLTQCKILQPWPVPPSTGALTAGTDAVIDGSATTTVTGAVVYRLANTSTSLAKTHRWVFIAYAMFGAQAASEVDEIGLINSASTHSIAAALSNSVSATKFVLHGPSDVAGTIGTDTNNHVFMVLNDLTNVKLYVDAVDSTASVATSGVTDEALSPFMYSSTTAHTKVINLALCW